MRFTHDAADDSYRHEELERYVHANLLTTEGFTCRFCASACQPSAERAGRTFISGEMPSIGRYYSLIDPARRPMRVVVMGQERGVPAGGAGLLRGSRGTQSVTLADRHAAIQRYAVQRQTNSHINGTVCALAVLYGDPLGRNETIEVDGSRVHVLDAFVLTNSTLCSALDRTGKGSATSTMRKRCVEHARPMLDILSPTHLILQGSAARDTAERALGVRFEPGNARPVGLGSGVCRVFAFPHPTSHEPTNWSTYSRSYFRSTVAPLLGAP
ncbi:MAG TPA: hypothetical protein VFY79_13070 [Dehalococcoidia bacterium]|nr:hypothetical protein [Dehalococcoidia bacterium]